MLLKKGYTLRAISDAIDRSVSTISDELQRNAVQGIYHPKKAQQKAYARRKYARYQGKKIIDHGALRTFVEDHLEDDQSPRAIAGRITRHEKQLPTISKNTIYKFLDSPYGSSIDFFRKERWRRTNHHQRTTLEALHDRVFIDKRPAIIDTRRRVGDVEADFIVSGKGGQGILLVVEDRKLRIAFLARIIKVSVKNMHRAFVRIKKRFSEMNTISTDNDILFKRHQQLAVLLGVSIYFCHPYHSWEKGSVENTNGVIRKSIPKGSNLSGYSSHAIRKIENKLNRRIMECIDYRMPQEALDRYRKNKKRRKDV